jgi:PhoH-like ATPase
MRKHFVLDTNVLLHDASAMLAFGDNVVVIPITVIEELDKFKGQNDELGRNAREVVRTLDRLRQQGSLGQGVDLNGSGGTLVVDVEPVPPADMGLPSDVPDHRILATAWRLKIEKQPVIFVSKDINLRIKSDALGIPTMNFEQEQVNIDHLFTGWRELSVSEQTFETFSEEGEVEIKPELKPNEMVLLRNELRPKQTLLGRRYAHHDPRTIGQLRGESAGGMSIAPRNLEQRLAMELLLDDDVPLVTLVGRAGTGKTLLALAAAHSKTVRHEIYDKILVSRPIMPLGRDIGYLPGSKDEKLEQWMKPIFDNLKFLLRERSRGTADTGRRVQELMRSGLLELEALTYIRGRSIWRQYLIVDEAQNLTPHEVKTIISRAGDETKLVLTGDPYQIDNPYLDSSSNGLSFVVEAMKNQKVSGHMLLTRSERSKLAAVAADIL